MLYTIFRQEHFSPVIQCHLQGHHQETSLPAHKDRQIPDAAPAVPGRGDHEHQVLLPAPVRTLLALSPETAGDKM